MKNFLEECKITRVANAAVAATTDVDGDRVDMTGYDSVLFVALLGDVTSGSVLELQALQNTADSASSPTPAEITADNVTHTAGASDADNKLLAVVVHRHDPALGRYLFPRLKRGSQNAVLDGMLAIQFNARNVPVTQSATLLASAFLAKK